MSRRKILIIGGVAGGASCAARCRRLDENAEILMIDRGPYVSFANCGLPYYVGGVIQDESKLSVANVALFRDRFNIEARTLTEALAIDPASRTVQMRDLQTGREYLESYDALVLSPGAAPLRPRLPGIDLAGIFTLRTIPDSREIRSWIEQRNAKTAIVIGAGFIGLEMAENLTKRGLEVTIVEKLDQVMPPLDPEMARPVAQHLKSKGVNVVLGDGVAGFERSSAGQLVVITESGARLPGDLVVLGIGVKPETALALAAGLEIGPRGGIRVDSQMRTSAPHIWAVGDAVETVDIVTGQPVILPLAGPANRQGRIAADVICGRDSRFRGVQATAVCGVFDLTVASTGASEKSLQRAGIQDYGKVYLHPQHHVGYYPGAKPIHLKLLFHRSDGRILGAQAVGEEAVDKRMDVLAMAVQLGGTVFDLEEAELCYAPQYGAAKDPVNYAGMIAANHLRGDLPIAHWEDLPNPAVVLLDVRDGDELAEDGQVHGALHIPLPALRSRLSELPPDREIWVFCAAGQRAYYATRILLQHGFKARNLPGGFRSFRCILG